MVPTANRRTTGRPGLEARSSSYGNANTNPERQQRYSDWEEGKTEELGWWGFEEEDWEFEEGRLSWCLRMTIRSISMVDIEPESVRWPCEHWVCVWMNHEDGYDRGYTFLHARQYKFSAQRNETLALGLDYYTSNINSEYWAFAFQIKFCLLTSYLRRRRRFTPALIARTDAYNVHRRRQMIFERDIITRDRTFPS